MIYITEYRQLPFIRPPPQTYNPPPPSPVIDQSTSFHRSRFLDVTQRSPKSSFGRALRDIPKTAARETTHLPKNKNYIRL